LENVINCWHGSD